MGPYILDFVCQEAKLIVELDGSQHSEQVGYDTKRSDWLATQGYRILRFWNNDLTQNEAGVLTQILNELNPNAQAH